MAPTSTSLPQPILSNQGNRICSFLPSRATQALLDPLAGLGLGRDAGTCSQQGSDTGKVCVACKQLLSGWHVVGMPGLISALLFV